MESDHDITYCDDFPSQARSSSIGDPSRNHDRILSGVPRTRERPDCDRSFPNVTCDVETESSTAETDVSLQPPLETRNRLVALVLGQFIAFLVASLNATSYVLVHDYNVQTQLFQLFSMYSILTFHLMIGRQAGASGHHVITPLENTSPELAETADIPVNEYPFHFLCLKMRLRMPWYTYFAISCLDVFPNYLALISYRYTSLTSTTLLGSLTVPSTMMFSRLILFRNFFCHHYAGVLFCVVGGSLTVYRDSVSAGNVLEEHSFIGDLLAITAALIYGLGDCITEYSVKNVDRNEYLGMVGLFGAALTAVTFPWLEYQALTDIFNTTTSIEIFTVCALLSWYTVSLLLYYIAQAHFLESADATLLNLSLQAVNFWAVFFTITRAKQDSPLRPSFFLSLTLVVLGVFIYERGCITIGRSDRQRSRSASELEVVDERVPAVNYQTLARL